MRSDPLVIAAKMCNKWNETGDCLAMNDEVVQKNDESAQKCCML